CCWSRRAPAWSYARSPARTGRCGRGRRQAVGNGSMSMERLTWLAAVAVLATSLCWLAAVDGVMLAHVLGAEPSAAWVLARALGKSAAALIAHAWPTFAAAALAVALIWTLIHSPRGEGELNPGGRHA